MGSGLLGLASGLGPPPVLLLSGGGYVKAFSFVAI